MKTLQTLLASASVLALSSGIANAAEYKIDTEGAHASVHVQVPHLGFSYIAARFNDFDGTFSYDADAPNESSIEMTVQTNSFDSNHAERDKHVKSDDFLDASTYPEAKFVSTSFTDKGDGTSVLTGDLTIYGNTQSVDVLVSKVGEGEDPWGGYRAGFTGVTSFSTEDFSVPSIVGPLDVEMTVHIEGIRQ